MTIELSHRSAVNSNLNIKGDITARDSTIEPEVFLLDGSKLTVEGRSSLQSVAPTGNGTGSLYIK